MAAAVDLTFLFKKFHGYYFWAICLKIRRKIIFHRLLWLFSPSILVSLCQNIIIVGYTFFLVCVSMSGARVSFLFRLSAFHVKKKLVSIVLHQLAHKVRYPKRQRQQKRRECIRANVSIAQSLHVIFLKSIYPFMTYYFVIKLLVLRLFFVVFVKRHTEIVWQMHLACC